MTDYMKMMDDNDAFVTSTNAKQHLVNVMKSACHRFHNLYQHRIDVLQQKFDIP